MKVTSRWRCSTRFGGSSSTTTPRIPGPAQLQKSSHNTPHRGPPSTFSKRGQTGQKQYALLYLTYRLTCTNLLSHFNSTTYHTASHLFPYGTGSPRRRNAFHARRIDSAPSAAPCRHCHTGWKSCLPQPLFFCTHRVHTKTRTSPNRGKQPLQ